jgi:hypothetical protein
MNKINDLILKETIGRIIREEKTENFYFDYKEKWYEKEDDGNMMMDILSFSNSLYSEYSYIIIGVNNSGEIVGIPSEINVRDMNDKLTSIVLRAPFSGEVRPELYVTSIKIEGKRIDVIVIESSSRNIPFFLSKPYPDSTNPKKSAGIGIYVRRNAQNGARNCNADRPIIEQLWSRKFKNDNKPVYPLDLFSVYLRNVNMWVDNCENDGFNSLYYYKEDPKFALFFDRGENNQNGQTVYQFIQTDSSTDSEILKLLLWDRVLYCCTLRELDGGRVAIPTPMQSFLDMNDTRDCYVFRYFTKDSPDYQILWFCLHKNYNSESIIAIKKALEVIDLYESENEVSHVKDFVLSNLSKYEKKVCSLQRNKAFIGNMRTYDGKKGDDNLRLLAASSRAMMEMHRQWRKEQGFSPIDFD